MTKDIGGVTFEFMILGGSKIAGIVVGKINGARYMAVRFMRGKTITSRKKATNEKIIEIMKNNPEWDEFMDEVREGLKISLFHHF